MDVWKKLVELIAQKVCDTWSEACDEWMPHDCGNCYANDCHIAEVADHLIDNGVTGQKHGRWLLDGRCSECLENPLTTHKTYCPSCGAKMDGDGNG